MKNKEVKALRMPLKLQFFATGDGDGTGEGDGSGDGAGDGDGTGDGSKGEPPKTFDDFLKTGDFQSEFDRRVQQSITTALKNQKEKYDALMDDRLSEAEKLAKMTKDEKQEYLNKKHEKELSDREAAITRRELMAEAKNTLAEKKLPVTLADVLVYTDADSCNKSIEAVEKAFTEAVAAAVEEKLKGGKPMKNGDSNVTELDKIVSMMSE